MDVRRVTTADAEAVLSLMDSLVHEDAGRYDPVANLTWVRDHGQAEVLDRLGGSGRIDLLAERDGAPLGLLMGGCQDGGVSSTATVARPGSLFVSPQHRDRGVGSALVERFLQEARASAPATWR